VHRRHDLIRTRSDRAATCVKGAGVLITLLIGAFAPPTSDGEAARRASDVERQNFLCAISPAARDERSRK